MFASVSVLAIAIIERWLRVGYGPFLTLFEILLSNLFSLGFIYLLVYRTMNVVRPGAPVALSVMLLLGIWLVTVSPEPSRLPATYDNYWLWIHVGVGKLFLATCLVAVGLAGVLLIQQAGIVNTRDQRVQTVQILDAVAWRFMALAFVCHSAMLIAGAVWAQDAWGRYWDWDPLETWAFITWLVLGTSLHLKVTFKLPLWVGWWLIIGTFVLAFLTFFGVPFVSLAPHKGAL